MLYITELNVIVTLVSQQSYILCYAGITKGVRSAGGGWGAPIPI